MTLDISPGVARYVRGDHGRLRQILFNLLGNALKFTDSGAIHLKASPFTIREREGETVSGANQTVSLLFSVKDTGVGIAEEQQGLIFDSFTQGETHFSREFGGTGLGLAISKRLVGMMGGGIRVESRLGEGSEFMFTVSFEKGDPGLADSPEYLPEDPRLEGGPPLRILLAEDNQINVKVAAQYISRLGHTLKTAANGNMALSLLSRERFDLVLMDVEMPEMDGYEATRRIRRGEAGEHNRNIPVIAMTAHALLEFREKAEMEGMNDFLTKPVEFKELIEIITRNARAESASSLERAGDTECIAKNSALNYKEALERLGGDEELLAELNDIFAAEIPPAMAQFEEALELQDMPRIAGLAHSLKGGSLSVGAAGCHRLASELEQAARNSASDRVAPLIGQLIDELKIVMELLAPQQNISTGS